MFFQHSAPEPSEDPMLEIVLSAYGADKWRSNIGPVKSLVSTLTGIPEIPIEKAFGEVMVVADQNISKPQTTKQKRA